ncbi:MAG: hypothetical protein QOE90_3281 [Thermoplasmata archaeon]|nr:hypothetical protein [Thermoplasmata archaeon]
MRGVSLLLLIALVAGCLAQPQAPAAVAPAPAALPAPTHVGHVFIIVLENEGYDTTFGQAESPYLGKDLPAQGRLLTQYYAIGHASLDNYVAMISGQAPNPMTQGDCPVYVDFREVTQLDGQAVGQGCVYPKDVGDLGTQMTAKGLSWRMYAEDMNASAPDVPGACRHPALGSRDPWEGATSAKDQYATKHVPFLYFHNVIDDAKACAERNVDLALLEADLNDSAATPSLAFISPNLCHDGHDMGCASGEPGGYKSIDAFLRVWVPRILNSTAYQKDGLLIVTFDESESDASACCGEKAGYGTPAPGEQGPGGGRTGAVLLSRCLVPGTKDETPYNHYSLLRTLEDDFGLAHLGYAADAGLKDFDLGACAAKAPS